MQGDADERKHAKPAQADASAVRVLVNAARLTCRGQDILEGTRFIVGQRDINKLISRIPTALPRISPACFATVCDYDYAMLGAPDAIHRPMVYIVMCLFPRVSISPKVVPYDITYKSYNTLTRIQKDVEVSKDLTIL